MNFGNANFIVSQEPPKQDSLTEMAMQKAQTLRKDIKDETMGPIRKQQPL
jgi:hypothetical protein